MHTCLLFFVWRCSSITHAHICKHAHASVNLFPYHPSQVASAQDRISIDLDIENERIGTGMLEPKRAFISDRMTTGESEVYKIEVLDPSSGNQKKATFIIQSHWQDDDHDMRETGVMFYRVIRTPPKVPTKKGVKLVKSPWEGAKATRYSLRVGERFRSTKRMRDTKGTTWVQITTTGQVVCVCVAWVCMCVHACVGQGHLIDSPTHAPFMQNPTFKTHS